MELLRRETEGAPDRMSRALSGLRAYQEASRDPVPDPMPALANLHGASLRDYGGDGPPLLFIPSLINPPNVLDLGAEKSLLRWLASHGFQVLLLDWGWDVEARRSLSVAGHVEEIILPFIARLDRAPMLAGYCLGGTMALAAAAPAKAAAVATIAAPWRFSGFPDEDRAGLVDLWARAEPAARSLGMLPMEVLQSAFWSLDPARTIAKFERFAGIDPASPEARAFVMLEDWANDGPPIPEAAAREMFEDLIGTDLPGRGEWLVANEPVDPASLPCPFLNIVSTSDRIVPYATASTAGERLDLHQGHVGMVVGSRARALLWEPLKAWLEKTGKS
jgi:polyhydroxyalkanoate synthase